MLQARLVASALEERGISCEIRAFKTEGDRESTEPLSAIGGKGLFTHELEVALLEGKVDCCVHSLKDLPTESQRGLEVVAQLEREDPRDALVLNGATEADGLATVPAGSRIGTSSLRRRAQLLALRPDLQVVELRGNVPTRLRKVDDGQVDAAILAAAGLIRLDRKQRISEYLEPPAWLPAAGQGAIAVQIKADDVEVRAIIEPLDHKPTSIATRAERAFLAALGGGCQVPIGALVTADMVLHGFVSDIRGTNAVRGECLVDPAAPERAGERLANDLRARGAADLLAELAGAGNVIVPQPE